MRKLQWCFHLKKKGDGGERKIDDGDREITKITKMMRHVRRIQDGGKGQAKVGGMVERYNEDR